MTLLMMLGISLFGQLGLQAYSQGCKMSGHTTVGSHFRELAGVVSTPIVDMIKFLKVLRLDPLGT
jgi:hypothetical protein